MKKVSINRTYWNIVKGIGIILVVMGHVCEPLVSYIYMFHLPLFFFVSGFLYNEDKYGDDPYLNVAARVKSSWLKYVICYWCIILLHNVFYRLNMLEDGACYFSKTDMISTMAKAALGIGDELFGGTLWFVPVSVICVCLLGFIVTLSRKIFSITKIIYLKYLTQIIIILACTIVGYILEHKGVSLVADMQAALVSMPFLWAGYVVRKKREFFKKSLNPFLAIFCGVFVFIMSRDFRLDLVYNIIFPHVHIVAFCGIYMSLYIAKVFLKTKYLSKLLDIFGQTSYWIMFLHFPILRIFDWSYTVFFNNFDFEAYRVIPVAYHKFDLLYLIIGLGLPTIIYWLVKNINKKIKEIVL